MSPQNWLCRSERNPALDIQAPISPLVHINGDNAYSPQIPDTKLTVTSKVQFLQLQHVFRQNPTNTIPHTSDDTRCLLNLLNFLLTQLNTSLAAPKANQIFHAANKKKFHCCVVKKKFRYSFVLPKKYHHHHIALVARISLTLSRHSSLSFIALDRSSGQHPVSSHSCWMYVRADRPAFARPCVGVHKSTSLMSSSLLLQRCPACLARLTWIVFVIGDRGPYSWCLVGCCRQDLFKIARSILVSRNAITLRKI